LEIHPETWRRTECRPLRHILSGGVSADSVAELLAAFGEEAELTSRMMDSLIGPDGERELEMVRLVAGGLSNPKIAEELVLALSAVKSHTNHIHGKLGVENHIQAANRARTLRLR
jgi:LuxR family maltose regulon positive regulatory protein